MAANDLPLVAKRMMELGLSHVSGFPSMVYCYDLFLECARHYNQDTQRIIGPQGRIVANLNPVSITQTFDMLDRSHVVAFSMEAAQEFYDEQTIKSQQLINSWLDNPKSHYSKLPKQLFKAKFKKEYYDAITLLSRVVGLKNAGMFENWMCHVIVRMEQEKIDYHWAGVISRVIHEKFSNVLQTKTFTMTSYLVYALARFHPYKGLSTRGVFGQDVIYEVYPQLHLGSSSYRKVNDAFTMHITRLLQGAKHVRILDQAKELIKKIWGMVYSVPNFLLYLGWWLSESSLQTSKIPY